MKKKKLLIAALTVVFAAIALCLLIDRTLPKTFSDLCPDAQKLEVCQIVFATVEGSKSINLTDHALEELLSVLERVEYFDRGAYGSVMEGRICHLFFSSRGTEVLRMDVSDMGKVYIGSHYYDFAPGVSPTILSSYIQTLFR